MNPNSSMRMKKEKTSARLALLSGFGLALSMPFLAGAMPQDSTAYYQIGGWDIPANLGTNKAFYLVGLGSVTQTSIFSFNATVYSNGSPINVDPLIRPSGSKSTNYRDRGGAEYIENGLLMRLTPQWMWDAGGGHSSGNPGRGLFHKSEYSGLTSPRGWVKVAYNPGAVSAANLSQPFAVRTSVIPIGNFPVGTRYLDGISTRIPLAEMGINPNRVLFLQAIQMGDDGTNVKPYNQPPIGVGGSGVAFSIRGTEFAFDINNGFGHSGYNPAVNRGYINVDHIAAQCGDGAGPLNVATNIGGGQVTAYTWNGNAYASTSTYQGCHGHLNGTYVIENTGDDIWGSSDKLRFAHKGYSGNRNFICRVDQLENTNAWARAGIMIRTGTGAGDPNVGVFVTPGNGISFQYRNALNGTTSPLGSVTGVKAPIWLRLEYKVENNVGVTRAYRSTDGVNWGTQIGSLTKTFSGTYQAGLAAAGRSTVPNTSVYSNLRNF